MYRDRRYTNLHIHTIQSCSSLYSWITSIEKCNSITFRVTAQKTISIFCIFYRIEKKSKLASLITTYQNLRDTFCP